MRGRTFYGYIHIGKQGPHTIAQCVLENTFIGIPVVSRNPNLEYYRALEDQGMPAEMLLQFCGTILMPTQLDEILQREFDKPFPLYKEYLYDYKRLYDRIEYLYSKFGIRPDEETIRNVDSRCRKNSVVSREYMDYIDTLVELRNCVLDIVNLNPYATYAWKRGASGSEIQGKGEASFDLYSLTTASACIASKCLDEKAFTSGTFTSYDTFLSYLKWLFFGLSHEEFLIFMHRIGAADQY